MPYSLSEVTQMSKLVKDSFGKTWAVTKNGKAIVQDMMSGFDSQIIEMSEADLTRAIDFPQPMLANVDMWISMTSRVIDLTKEVLEVA